MGGRPRSPPMDQPSAQIGFALRISLGVGKQAEGGEVFLHVGHVVVVQALGRRATQLGIPAKAFLHHGEGRLEILFVHLVGAFGEHFDVRIHGEGPLGNDVVHVAEVIGTHLPVGAHHAARGVGSL